MPSTIRAALLGIRRTLEDLPTDLIRQKAWAITEKRLERESSVRDHFATFAAVFVFYFVIPWVILAGVPYTYRRVVGVPLGLLALLACIWAVLRVQARRHQRVLLGALVDLGVLVCRRCGYNLLGQVSPRCPECGEAFEPLGKLLPDGKSVGELLAAMANSQMTSVEAQGELSMGRTVTLKGNPLNVSGPQLKVGETAPDAVLKKDLLSDIKISQTTGKTRIFSVVPSLDTPVCAIQTKRFNEEATKLGNVEFYTISFDLPVAQKRFCGAEGINPERMHVLSDHKDAAFSAAYGVLLPDLRISCRAVFVVDKSDTLRYVEYVPEIADQPNYDAVLAAAKAC